MDPPAVVGVRSRREQQEQQQRACAYQSATISPTRPPVVSGQGSSGSELGRVVAVKKKVLAVASFGGHWIQLLRLRPAFREHDVLYVTTNEARVPDAGARIKMVCDASMWDKPALARMFVQMAAIVVRFRPDVVITTGAAPGYAALLFGKLARARTIWIDSIANSEELSSSGRRAKTWADLWLTQWEHLANEGGPEFWGRVL
jgi:UDP-N-acetylglucosamine:LPS N-acetylglucosamine transferase